VSTGGINWTLLQCNRAHSASAPLRKQTPNPDLIRSYCWRLCNKPISR